MQYKLQTYLLLLHFAVMRFATIIIIIIIMFYKLKACNDHA